MLKRLVDKETQKIDRKRILKMNRKDYLKSEFENFNFCKQQIDFLCKQIDTIEYKMTGLKGVSTDKISGSNNPSQAKSKKWHELSAKKDRCIEELQQCQHIVEHVEHMLKMCSKKEREILEDIFIKEISMSSASGKYKYSLSGTYKIVDHIIESISEREMEI